MIKGLDARRSYRRWFQAVENGVDRVSEFWFFFIALCHALQVGENPLSATDALHLGLIDEVLGLQDVPTFRVYAKSARDPQ